MKIDMHIHTSYSRDASGPPKDVLGRCVKLGLGGFAVTDHNSIEGSLQAYELAKDQGLVAVRGVEVSAQEGHILAYGVGELVPRGLPVAETIERIHALGGVAVAAHPKRFPSGIGLKMARDAPFDAIEVLNGGSSRRSNALARRVAEEKHSPMTAGSDAHSLDQIGKAYCIIEGGGEEQEVLEAIRKGGVSIGGRSRSLKEGIVYSVETLAEWLRGDFKRL
ncbi:MAG: CehA/McbA family metallohydrolase [Candidatus Thermoplasmatota archaeon]|nr:CehA/McbA family metallohydrolase [Candidatus Thermoplasmatota archaeon]